MFRNILILIRITIGFIFLFIGVIGLILPILQGWIFLLIAIPFISPEHGKKILLTVGNLVLRKKKSKSQNNSDNNQ